MELIFSLSVDVLNIGKLSENVWQLREEILCGLYNSTITKSLMFFFCNWIWQLLMVILIVVFWCLVLSHCYLMFISLVFLVFCSVQFSLFRHLEVKIVTTGLEIVYGIVRRYFLPLTLPSFYTFSFLFLVGVVGFFFFFTFSSVCNWDIYKWEL